MNRKIGVIGGMGPMASQLFYKMVTEKTVADKDQDHVPMMILSDPQMPDRTQAILSGKTDEVTARLLEDARTLENCSCDAIAITCNTAHYFADKIVGELRIPIIHMIRETAEETAKEAAATGNRRVAILATDGTIRTGLYQKALEAQGLEPFVPGPESQALVMHEIYDCVKAGLPYDREAWADIHRELAGHGCGRALLACTELSVIGSDNDLGDMYKDPLEVLARRVIEFSGHKVKPGR